MSKEPMSEEVNLAANRQAIAPGYPASAIDNPFVGHAELQLLCGSHSEALRVARMGLALFPEHAELLELAATCATLLGDDEYAVSCWQRLLAIEPMAVVAYNSLALALERLQRLSQAETIYRQALAVLPNDAGLQSNFGLLLENLGRLDEAEVCQRDALRLAPDSPPICSNFAGLLMRLGRVEAAERLYREAIRLEPEFATAHSNLGVLLTDSGREALAEACFRRAFELQPDNLQARMNFGQWLLMQGRLAEGWPLYEGRQFVFDQGRGEPMLRRPDFPQWQGESLRGKRIIVLPEQGLGDEIQFVRYLAWLKAQAPEQLTLICRPQQKALLATLHGPDQVVGLDEVEPHLAQRYDYWVLLLSLPLYAGTTLASIPTAIPYLFPDPVRQARFAPLLAGEGRRVGVVWKGNPKHLNDAERSLPSLEVLALLWRVEGIRFFSLQKSALELAWPPSLPLVDLGSMIDDFADTAAVLSQLDLLICVDTSVAHLAGALGLPCWVLLPCYKPDWRWLIKREDSPWYPTMRLFRQEQRGDWQAPVARLHDALQVFARG